MTRRHTGASPATTRAQGQRLVPFGVGALLLVAIFLTAAPQLAQAAGGLLVAPTRLVFEGRERTAEVTLVNKGDSTEVFRISVVNRRMRQDGTFEEVEAPNQGELFADPFLRYAPRRITLQPNAPQTIRVLLRKPADLPDGEYRSHMLFRAIPDMTPPSEDTIATSGFQVRLIPVYGVTIPVIIRHGQLDADVAIDGAAWTEAVGGAKRPAVTVQLARSGERSVYGTVKILAADADETLAEVRGVAIYTPNLRRSVRIPIDPAKAPAIKSGPVRVAFFASAKDGGALLAEQQLTLH